MRRVVQSADSAASSTPLVKEAPRPVDLLLLARDHTGFWLILVASFAFKKKKKSLNFPPNLYTVVFFFFFGPKDQPYDLVPARQVLVSLS